MDRITTSLTEEFSKEAELLSFPEYKRFEHFAAFLCVNSQLSESFDTRDLVIGGGNDTGIDAIAIIVNGTLVTDLEQVDDLAKTNGSIDATFVFIQAEISPHFEASKIGTFGFGVSDFFKDSPTLPRNDKIGAFAEIMNKIYERSSKFKSGNPRCRLFYVTTGQWIPDQNLESRKRAVVEDLNALKIFQKVEFVALGADTIQKIYNQAKNAVSIDFVFEKKTVLPEMPGVKEAYLGLLKAKEFLRLLDDGNGNIMKGIFYDNVRDWQGDNPVNKEIRASLESPLQRERFSLMNNGVTVIAKTLRATGDKFHIEDYQIVNGCQTSHVLFENRESIDDKIFVPLRLIATDDDEVSSSIVKATNRQTEVKQEQLIALSDFQKKIEQFFLTFQDGKRLFYERRSGQYNAVPNIEKTRIITPSSLIRSFAACFLNEAHRTTRDFSALLQLTGKSIFAPNDKLEPYYLAASAHYRIDFLFRNGLLDAKYKPARYHIIMGSRLLTLADPIPKTNANEMLKYCEPLIQIMWNPEKAEKLIKRVASIVEEIAGGQFVRDRIRSQPFTEDVRKRVEEVRLGEGEYH